MQDFTSSIDWQCPSCGHYNHQELSVPELNFAAENTSDMATYDDTEVECEECGIVYTGTVWVNVGEAVVEIEEPQKFTIQGNMPMYGPPDEDDFAPADDPHSIAKEALGHLKSLVGAPSPDNDPQFTNRLVFSGGVSCLEAYLGDTLINAVREDASVRSKLVSKNKKLGELKISAADLAADPEVMTKIVTRYLRDLLFHNLSVANALYVDAFGVKLFPSDAEANLLVPAMQNRHHCVHRNGSDKEGNKLNIFDDAYVDSVLDAVISVVDHIEDSFWPR